MEQLRAVLLAVAATVATAGCLFPGDKSHLDAALRNVRQRAPGDLNCESAIQYEPLGDVGRVGQQMTTLTIGARGCGRRATYAGHCVSNWGDISCSMALNSVTRPAPNPATASTGSGCQKDTDCKGERVCQEGKCVDPKAAPPTR